MRLKQIFMIYCMDDMNEQMLSKIIYDIIGMPLWEISIGPSGINIHLGKKLKSNLKSISLLEGEISLWIQCNTKISQVTSEGRKTLVTSLFPQEKKEEALYNKYLVSKIILDTKFNNKDNSLHILVESNSTCDFIFSAYPWGKESQKCWIAYDHRIINPPGFVVYSDSIELVS